MEFSAQPPELEVQSWQITQTLLVLMILYVKLEQHSFHNDEGFN